MGEPIVFIDLGVGGMTCDDCVVHVTEALESVPGVANATVDLASRRAVTIVDLPCGDAAATLEQYAAAVRAVLPVDPADIVLVGHSFGGFTVSTIAAENVGTSGALTGLRAIPLLA